MNRFNFYINGRCLERNLTGVERYTIAVLNAFDYLLGQREYSNIDIILLVPKCDISFLKFRHIIVKQIGRFHGVIWEQFELPLHCIGRYLLSLHSMAPMMKKNQLIIMHDAKVSKKGNSDEIEIRRIFYLVVSRILGARLNKVIAISNFAKEDINKGFKIPYEKIKVILSGEYSLDQDKEDNNVFEKNNITPYTYVLGIGGGKTKNNILTSRAVEKMKENVNFVLVGSISKQIENEISQYKKTKIIGRVTDEELISLYKNALCLSFPSLVEGFGIPPLEAMSLNCPVIASRIQAVPEVCGDAALYVDAFNVDDMYGKLSNLCSDKNLRNEMIRRGQENIKRFSWERTARMLMDLIIQENNFKICNK